MAKGKKGSAIEAAGRDYSAAVTKTVELKRILAEAEAVEREAFDRFARLAVRDVGAGGSDYVPWCRWFIVNHEVWGELPEDIRTRIVQEDAGALKLAANVLIDWWKGN